MTTPALRLVDPGDVRTLLKDPVDEETLAATRPIIEAVRDRGDEAVREYATRFGELEDGGMPLLLSRGDLEKAWNGLPRTDRALLERVAKRIDAFARAQREALLEIRVAIPGGEAGHDIAPVEVAGCYAPGGGFPLPSSVLMTAVTARAAGVPTVLVASPRPTPITLAAAWVSGADGLLAVGGAHAIAALAHGTQSVPRCDVVVGPGSKWVTAAKQLVSGRVAIDMLAGPSELVVLADETAAPSVVAADLLAQAEHGFDSLPILVTDHRPLVDAVNAEIARQIATLPTSETAAASIANGYAVSTRSWDEAIAATDAIAPEHLELHCRDAEAAARRLHHYGGLFIGPCAAEVLGDYGAGPNHTLPTGGTARFTGGLSVFHFLRVRTWMRIDDQAAARPLVEDARDLARHERLEGHARSAEHRLD